MALTTCPQCGGKVSDSAQKCVHCGYNFEIKRREEERAKQAEEEKNYFNNLPETDQKRLLNEFNAKYPEEARFDKLSALYNWGGIIAGVLDGVFTVVQFVLIILLSTSKIDETKGLVLIIVFGILLIAVALCTIALRLCRKKFNIRAYQNIKRFGRWLKNEKGITYKVALSSEEKAVFDSVRI